MGRKINIRPTSSVYATYKRLSYQPWTAIAEFVDNSTQSFYDHQSELLEQKYCKGVTIEVNYYDSPEEGDRIEIIDNAYGMEWTDFQRAVVLDKPPKNTSGRNEFGMGLKTAACWFGSIWSVESTQLNSKNKYFAEINVEEIGKYKTEEIDVKEETVSPRDHFTKIVIRKLNKKIKGPRTIGKVKELLSSTYREDIRGGFVSIFYNGTKLAFKEAPVYEEVVNGTKKTWKKDVDFSVKHEDKELNVHGFIAIRIPGNVRDAGFTLIRRGRVIIGGSENTYRPTELFGDSNGYAWQRLYGELHMDNWPVTQAKDGFDWHNSGLEEQFITALKDLTSDYKKKAEDIRVREHVSASDTIKNAVDSFSNTDLINNAIVSSLNEQYRCSSEVESSNDWDKNTSEEEQNRETTATDVVVSNESDGVAIDGSPYNEFRFNYKGTDYCFRITLDTENQASQWLLVEPDGINEYSLSINMRHTFFAPLIGKKEFMPVLVRIAIAFVLAEIDSMTLSPDGRIEASSIRLKMNEILESVRRGSPYDE